MRPLRFFVGVLLLLGASLTPGIARADSWRVDFDGDGVRDRIDVAAPFTELDVQLSQSRSLQRLRTNDLIVRFVVTDIDRDGDPDVVATTRRTGLQVWINTGRRLVSARALKTQGLSRMVTPTLCGVAAHRSDDSDCADQARELIAASNPRGQPLYSRRGPAAARRARPSHFEHSPRIARGPPSATPHLQTSFA